MRYILLLAIVFMSNVSVADQKVAEAIKQSILDNLKYVQEENSEKSMSTIHSQSPSYLPTKNIISQMFSNYQLSFELIDFKYIAYDGDLAYARVKQVTKKISGPAFQNNEVDMVQIFRRESGIWKLWSQANIEIKYID